MLGLKLVFWYEVSLLSRPFTAEGDRSWRVGLACCQAGLGGERPCGLPANGLAAMSRHALSQVSSIESGPAALGSPCRQLLRPTTSRHRRFLAFGRFDDMVAPLDLGTAPTHYSASVR